jgi:hypothetical protein
MVEFPGPDELAPYYRSYLERLVAQPVEELLGRQADELRGCFRRMGPEQLGYRYAPGKWSSRQILGHLIDSERVFVYRASAFARGESAPLPGFDENAYVESGDFDARLIDGLLEEYSAVRAATLAALRGWSAPMLQRRGTANGVPFSVRSIPWIIAGHERHHLDVLRERYFLNSDR